MLIPTFNLFRDFQLHGGDQVRFFRLTLWMMSQNAVMERDELRSSTRAQIVERLDSRQYCGRVSNRLTQEVFFSAFFVLPRPFSIIDRAFGVVDPELGPRNREVARDATGKECNVGRSDLLRVIFHEISHHCHHLRVCCQNLV